MASTIINDTIPVVSYVSAIDVTSEGQGSTKYNVFFDASLTNIGTVLMFEYKILLPDLSGGLPVYTLGYINNENVCMQNGISNQWTVSVPATDANYDSSANIAIRVYIGVLNSSEVAATSWSDQLLVHNPPHVVQIHDSYYDVSGALNDLYVFLDPTAAGFEYPNDSSLKFVVAYYYQDTSGVTQWQVTDLLDYTLVMYNEETRRMLTILNFGNVSTTQPNIRVAVYTVWPYTYLGSSFYAVSHISLTVDSEPASDYSAPILNPVSYGIYDGSGQNMYLSWEAPPNSGIPTYTVDYYTLEYSTDDSSWNVIATDISSGVFTYTYDLPIGEQVCGTTFYFRVEATSTAGTPSPYSNTESKNYFEYATEPIDLYLDNLVVDGNNISMTVNFTNPSTIGCTGDLRQFKIENSSTPIDVIVPYDASGNYSIDVSFEQSANTGTITVFMQNTDTNSSDLLDGASATAPYLAFTLVLNPVYYQVYTPPLPGVQQMDLSWNEISVGGWTVDKYIVYITANGVDSSFNNNTNITYSFDSASYPVVDSSFSFYVEAVVVNDGDGTINIIQSNTVEQNKFVFATAPTDATVVWASAHEDVLMDLRLQFKNPTEIGSGTPQYFAVEIVDSIGTQLASVDVSYNDTLGYLYIVNFVDIPYSANGNANINLVTTDTNGRGDLDGAIVSDNYDSSGLPIIIDVSFNGVTLSFNVISSILLAQSGTLIGVKIVTGPAIADASYNITDSDLNPPNPPFPADPVQPIQIEEGSAFEYFYEIDVSTALGAPFDVAPVTYVISMSNAVGVTSEVVHYL